jgi:hypothetical protein
MYCSLNLILLYKKQTYIYRQIIDLFYIYWRLNFRSSAAHDIRFEEFHGLLSRWRSGPARVLRDVAPLLAVVGSGGYGGKVIRIYNKC